MAKTIDLTGIIGWDILASDIKESLNEANGDDIIINVSSTGGSVYEGIEIFNRLKEYSGKITARIVSVAASMATVIAIVADEVQVYDNSVFMIHNPWSFSMGDYRDMKKTADILGALADLIARAYAKKTKSDKGLMREMMDSESWFFGSEIKDAGFADVVLDSEEKETDKDTTLNDAKIQFEAMMCKVKNENRFENDLEKAAAFFNNSEPKEKNDNITQKGKERVQMTPQEIKANHPESFAVIEHDAMARGKDLEQKRVNAHLLFIDVAKDDVLKNIKNGSSVQDEDVHASYVLAGIRHKEAQAIAADNTGEVPTDTSTEEPGSDDEKEATDEQVDAFLNGKK